MSESLEQELINLEHEAQRIRRNPRLTTAQRHNALAQVLHRMLAVRHAILQADEHSAQPSPDEQTT